MPMLLFVIRHGQPLELEENKSIPNSPLGKKGIKQAELTAEQILAFGGVDSIYSSTLRRALDTAKAVHNKLKTPWYVWPALCETNRREWPRLREAGDRGKKSEFSTGKTMKENNIYDSKYTSENYYLSSQINKDYAGIELIQPLHWPDAWWLPLIDETRDICYERARIVIALLKERHMKKQERIAIVCHGAFGSVLLSTLTESPPSDYNRFSFMHAGISCVKIFEEGFVSVSFSNYFSHLFPDYITD